MLKPDDIIAKIQQSLPSAQIKAYDMTGGGDHWQVKVIAEEFRGKSRVQQHQMIYAALGDWMHGEVHALALETLMPE